MKEHQGCTVTGIEIDPVAAEEARKHCDLVIVGDLESIDFDAALGERRFEVITIADVLEHLRDPATVLSKLKRYLAEDGFILASIPNVVHAGLILEMALGRFDYRPYGLLDDTHLRFFTHKSVSKLFADCGLEIQKLDRVIRPIEASEFAKHLLAPAEVAMLEHIRANNPEWQTYQFIVSAVPAAVESGVATHDTLASQEQIRDLQLSNEALTEQIRNLRSQLTWIKSRPIYRFYERAKSLFRGGRRTRGDQVAQ